MPSRLHGSGRGIGTSSSNPSNRGRLRPWHGRSRPNAVWWAVAAASPVESLERRTLLSATVTLTGTAGNDTFAAVPDNSGNVRLLVNATPVQTVPLSDLAGVVVDGGGGSDSLQVSAPGAAFTLDATNAAGLSLTVDGGTVRLPAVPSLGPVALAGGTLEVDNGGDAAATTTLTGRLSLAGSSTIDVTAGTLSAAGSIAPSTTATTLLLDGTGTLSVPSYWTTPNLTVTQTAGTVTTPQLYVGDSGFDGVPGTGAYHLAGGTLDAGRYDLDTGSASELDQTGGTLTGGGVILDGGATLRQSGGTATLPSLGIGQGTVALSGGQMTVDGSLTMRSADDPAAPPATLELSGTADLTVAGDEVIGLYSGGSPARVVQSGGTNTAANLRVGTPDAPGAYTLSGGSLSAGQEIVGFDFGGPAAGSFAQSGGTNAAWSLTLGYGGRGTGSYALGGGTLAASGQLNVGYVGSGTFAQTGGTASAPTLTLGLSAGTGTASVSGGQFTSTGNAYAGYTGPGTLAVSGTGSVAVGGALYVSGDGNPNDPAGTGEVDLSGSGQLTTQQTFVGYSGPATFNQSGGTHTTQTLVLDSPSGRTAAYHVSAGTVNAGITLDAYAPAADGPGLVDEGSAYTLGLFGTTSTTHWQVGWGDGNASAINGTPPSAAHTYTLGGNTYSVAPVAYDAGNNATSAGTIPVLVNDLPAAVLINGQPSTAATPVTLAGQVDQTTTLSATFADPGSAETHTALVGWGDGTTTVATVTESNGTGTVTASHAYAADGTFGATLTVTDTGGAVAVVPFAVQVSGGVGTPPSGPTGVTATALDDQDVEVDWTPNASDPNTTFEVDRQTAGGNWTVVADVDSTTDGDTYYDYGLSGATTYAYQIRSVGATPAADSAYAGPATATTPLTTPDAPAALSATESTPGEVDLTWDEDSPVVTGYLVTATPAGGGTPVTFAVAGDTPSFAATGLAAGAVYSFAVTADNDQGDGRDVRSAPSDAITAVPSAAALSATAPGTVAEGATVTLSLASSLPGGATSPVTSWQVAWADTGTTDTVAGSTASVAHTPAAGAAYADATVTATDAAGHAYTLPAVEVTVVPAAPTGVSAVAQTWSDVLVTWQNVTQIPDASTAVLRSDDGGQTYSRVGTADPAATSYDDAGLGAGVTYLYELASLAAAGLTGSGSGPAPMAATSAPTSAATPSNQLGLVAAAVPGSPVAVALTWTYGGGDDAGYELEMEDLDVPGQNFSLFAQPGPAPTSGADEGKGTDTKGGLTLRDRYRFRVRVDRADGTVSDYVTADFTPDDGSAPNLSATAVQATDRTVVDDGLPVVVTATPSDAALSATAATAAAVPAGVAVAGYQYEYRPAGGTVWRDGTVDGALALFPAQTSAETVFGYAGITPGVPFEYRARAASAGGGGGWTSPWSSAAGATVPVDPAGWGPQGMIDHRPVDARQVALRAAVNADGSVTVSWPAAADTPQGYPVVPLLGTSDQPEGSGVVYFAPYDSTVRPIPTSYTYPASARPSGGPLYVEVREVSDDSSVDVERYGSAVVPAGAGPTAPPATPDRVWVSTSYLGSLPCARLAWHNSSNNEDGFRFQESDNPDFADCSEGEVGRDETALTMMLNSNPNTHYFRIAAYKGNEQSDWMNLTIKMPQRQLIVLLQGDNLTGVMAGPVNAIHESVGLCHYDSSGSLIVDYAWSFGGDGGFRYFPPESQWLGFPFPASVESMGGPHAQFGFEGEIYPTDHFYKEVLATKQVTGRQADQWVSYMKTRAYTKDIYDPSAEFTGSGTALDCATYSTLEFARAPGGN